MERRKFMRSTAAMTLAAAGGAAMRGVVDAPQAGAAIASAGARSATLVVAASNATAAEKAGADYVCDGTGDEVEINEAIAVIAAIAGGQGGMVQLTSGTFTLANPIVMSANGVCISGQGIRGTIITLANGANCNVFTYTGSTNVQFFSLEHFKVLGNGANNTGGCGVYIAPTGGATFWDFVARDVYVNGAGSDGFFAYDGHGFVLDHFLAEDCGGYGVNFPITGSAEAEVRNGTFKANALGGIFMGMPGGIVAENEVANHPTGTAGITLGGTGCVATNNEVESNAGMGIHCTGTACLILGNYVETSGSYGIRVEGIGSAASSNMVESSGSYGIYVSSAQCRATDNMVWYSQRHGIYCSSSNVVIAGNTLYENSKTTPNTYDEIHITGSNVVVSSNQINGVNTSKYGINVAGGTGSIAVWNVITGEQTAATSDAGTGTTWLVNNLGTQIGTASTQKIGFFGATPIAQPTGDIAAALAALGLVASGTVSTSPAYDFRAVDYGWITWSFDIAIPSSSGAPSASGTVQVVRLHVPVATTVSNILLAISSGGTGLVGGQNFAGLYQGGVLLGSTADQSVAWATSGVKTMAISGGPVTVAAGDVYVAFFGNQSSGSLPAFAVASSSSWINGGKLVNTNARFGIADTGRTTSLPSALGAISAVNVAYWAALS
jgi:parallel beta-helix repeat protein